MSADYDYTTDSRTHRHYIKRLPATHITIGMLIRSTGDKTFTEVKKVTRDPHGCKGTHINQTACYDRIATIEICVHTVPLTPAMML